MYTTKSVQYWTNPETIPNIQYSYFNQLKLNNNIFHMERLHLTYNSFSQQESVGMNPSEEWGSVAFAKKLQRFIVLW